MDQYTLKCIYYQEMTEEDFVHLLICPLLLLRYNRKLTGAFVETGVEGGEEDMGTQESGGAANPGRLYMATH